ncbi:MAG: ABZJ_00895 family protein [Gammaproteobacteria bacterium]|jgi:hypothetical protein
MDEDIYKTPEAKLTRADVRPAAPPNPYVAALFLMGLSILMGLIVVAVESIFNISTSSSNAVSTIVPAYLVGYYYGNKRGVLFSSKHRAMAVGFYIILSLIVGGSYIMLFTPELFSQPDARKIFATVMVVVTVILAVACYFIFKFGEKAGIKNYENKHQQ